MEHSTPIARARFNNLLLPLAGIYAVSMGCFAIAFARSLQIMLAHLAQHWRVLLTAAFFAGGVYLLLFVADSIGRKSLQQLIIAGSAFGYIVLFVFFPMTMSFIAASLPEKRT